jgi:hypothetical protein
MGEKMYLRTQKLFSFIVRLVVCVIFILTIAGAWWVWNTVRYEVTVAWGITVVSLVFVALMAHAAWGDGKWLWGMRQFNRRI